MRRVLTISVTVSAILLTGFSATSATAAPKNFPNCAALWKFYPRGVVANAAAAQSAVTLGFQLPQVRAAIYRANRTHLLQSGIICPVAVPVIPKPPSQPTITKTWASPASFSVAASWTAPGDAGPSAVYDVYLNGTRSEQGLKSLEYWWRNLAPSTTYTVGIVTRNTNGESAPVTTTITTISQDEKDHYGLVNVVFSATGLVDVTLGRGSGVQQFADVTNPTYSFWMATGYFVYLSVQNQNNSGTVSCSITSNGIKVSSNYSDGAYVIATCSGKS
jgi:hypothetical protein